MKTLVDLEDDIDYDARNNAVSDDGGDNDSNPKPKRPHKVYD